MTKADTSNGANTEEFRTQLKTLSDDVAQLTEIVERIGREKLNETRDAAERTVRRAQARGVEAAETMENTVREHPTLAMSVAAGFGFLVGAMLARK